MFLMGIGTLLYEYDRNDRITQIIIYILLIGLYCHFFAFFVFMIRHCYLTKCHSILLLSLYLEIVALLDIYIKMKIFFIAKFFIF